MDVVGEGAQGFWSGARGGGEKVSTMLVLIGMMGSQGFLCGTFDALFIDEDVWGGHDGSMQLD